MNILIAPDSFKGSLTARQFCDIAETAIISVFPDAAVTKMPLADGGEGTVASLVLNTGGEIRHKTVTGPLGKPVKAHFGILGDKKTAVIEMASASGLPLVPDKEKNPLRTTSYGTGELIREALDMGCATIIMGIGGSATNDGGAGAVQALGFGLLDARGNPILRGAEGLLEFSSVDLTSKDPRTDHTKFLVACDVDNPLLGDTGATYTYGPQKGATREMLPILERALTRFNAVIEKTLHKNVADNPGAGAAGGLGAGLMAFLDAELKPGFDIVAEAIGLERLFEKQKFDLVITGEGEINYQTVHGKLPAGIAKLAKKYNVPVFAIVGAIGKGAEQVHDCGIDSMISMVNRPMDLNMAIQEAEGLLFQVTEQLMRVIRAAKHYL